MGAYSVLRLEHFAAQAGAQSAEAAVAREPPRACARCPVCPPGAVAQQHGWVFDAAAGVLTRDPAAATATAAAAAAAEPLRLEQLTKLVTHLEK